MARAASVRPEEMGLKEMGQAFEAPEKGSPTLLALETLKPQRVPDFKQEERALPQWLKALPYRSLLVTPLVHQGRSVGIGPVEDQSDPEYHHQADHLPHLVSP